MLKMLIRKLNFLTQIIFFFDKEFKKIIINPKFYQHLFSALFINKKRFTSIKLVQMLYYIMDIINGYYIMKFIITVNNLIGSLNLTGSVNRNT